METKVYFAIWLFNKFYLLKLWTTPKICNHNSPGMQTHEICQSREFSFVTNLQMACQRGGGIAPYFELERDRRPKTLYPQLFQKKFAEFFKSCLSEAYFFYHYLSFEKNILYIILQKWSKKIKTVENAVYWEQKNVTPQSVHAYAKMDTLEKTVLVSQITKRYELWFR